MISKYFSLSECPSSSIISDDKKSLLELNEGLLSRLREVWKLYRKTGSSESNRKSSTEDLTNHQKTNVDDLCIVNGKESKINITEVEADDDSRTTTILTSTGVLFTKVCLLQILTVLNFGFSSFLFYLSRSLFLFTFYFCLFLPF